MNKEETQKDMTRLVGARGLCLDVYGEDDSGQKYDLEIQRADAGARPERARYHAGAMDVENLNAGQDFEELPTTYVIFLTEKDLFGRGKALYLVQKKIKGTNLLFQDRQNILYVNVSYRGKGELGKLLHDFLCSSPDEMYSELLAERARYLKTNPKGVEMMCEAMEKLRDESIQRGVEQTMVKNIRSIMESLKFSAQQAMDALKIPAAEQPKYLAKIQ